MKILTPATNNALVRTMAEAGYIDPPETYPVVAELNEGYLFIAHEEDYTVAGHDMFIISEFSHCDYRWAPHDEFENFQDALKEFKRIYAERLTA